MTGVRKWEEMTTTDFESINGDRTVALLPVGAIEQHGPHLPLCTDATIATAIAGGAAEKTSAQEDVILLPTLSVGKSTEHLQFPGTLTHSAETLLHSWMEVGESIARAGVRKLVMLNAHGGQPMVMQIVARELRIKCDMLVVGTNAWSFGQPENIVTPDERRQGIHAGCVETSIMLHLKPDLVRMEHAENFRGLVAEVEDKYKSLRVIGDTYIGWQAQDLHPLGVSGNAQEAKADIGKRCIEHSVAGFSDFLPEVVDYPLHLLRNRGDDYKSLS